MATKSENLRSKEKEARSLNSKDQEELKREGLKRLKETLLAIDEWKRDSLSSQLRY
jgi:hypothetical protein